MRDYDFAVHHCSTRDCPCVKVGDPLYIVTPEGLRRDTVTAVAHVWADGPERFRRRQTVTHATDTGVKYLSMYLPDTPIGERRTFTADELALFGGGY